MKGTMASSRQTLDLSSANSPHASSSPLGSPPICTEAIVTNADQLQRDIKDKLDAIITAGDNIELERVGSDLMKIINTALERGPLLTTTTSKIKKINKAAGNGALKTGNGNATGNSTPFSKMIRKRSRGVMRNPAAEDRSIAENHSHIQLRESNRILENILSALPIYEKMGPNDAGDNLKMRKARSLIPVKPQPEIEEEDIKPQKLSVLSLFFTIPGDSMYTRCLGFSDQDFMTKQIKLDYFAFKASDLNFPMVIFIFIFGCIFILIRFDYAQGWVFDKNPLYVAALVTSLLSALCMATIVFNRLTLLSYKYNVTCLQRFHRPMVRLMKTRYGQLADDGVLLFCAMSGALYLLATVVFPTYCASSVIDPNHSECDQWGPIRQPPPETIMFNMLIVLFVQGFANSASRHCVLLGWLISIVTTNVVISLIGSEAYFWINVEYLFLLCVSYEFERHTLRHFIKSMLAVDISETNSRLSLALADQRIFEGEVALNSKRSVVRHVTHEVRTPLNTVAIGADVLTHEVKTLGDLIPPLMMELVVGIKEASAAALEVVNELLAFEKISAGLFTIEPVATSLFPFLKHCMQQHFIPALAKEIKLILTDSMYTEIMVSIDPTKMGIVMRNIISNAIKFSKVGGYVTVMVEVKGFEEGGKVVISVKDSGAGLSATNVTRLFQEGVQFNANALQNGDGSGFGLFISKAIMELHDEGALWAESDGEGEGSTFFMQLTPLTLDTTQPVISAVASEEGIVEEGPTTTPLRILVVDDSMATRKMTIRLLLQNNHICVQAEQGLAAVSEITRSLMRRGSSRNDDSASSSGPGSISDRDSFRDRDFMSSPRSEYQGQGRRLFSGIFPTQEEEKDRERDRDKDRPGAAFDLVLMDSSMPVMNGPDAAREMRKIGFLGPIIGVTGDVNTEEFLASGADMVLLKPINEVKLAEAMAEVLSRGVWNTCIKHRPTTNPNDVVMIQPSKPLPKPIPPPVRVPPRKPSPIPLPDPVPESPPPPPPPVRVPVPVPMLVAMPLPPPLPSPTPSRAPSISESPRRSDSTDSGAKKHPFLRKSAPSKIKNASRSMSKTLGDKGIDLPTDLISPPSSGPSSRIPSRNGSMSMNKWKKSDSKSWEKEKPKS